MELWLEIRALLQLSYLMQVISHVDSRELIIPNDLSLDGLFGQYLRSLIDLGCKSALLHIDLQLLVLLLDQVFLSLDICIVQTLDNINAIQLRVLDDVC